jgi:hypothetical protein
MQQLCAAGRIISLNDIAAPLPVATLREINKTGFNI